MTDSLAYYEHDQSKRTLGILLWIVLLASLVLGLYNIQFNTWNSVLALFGLTLLCAPLLILNSRGYFQLAAGLLSFLVLVVININ